MPELRKFPVFSEAGRVGSLTAAARFLDNRAEKVIELDSGGQVSLPADALTVQQDGSFFVKESSLPKPEVQKDAAFFREPAPLRGTAPSAPVRETASLKEKDPLPAAKPEPPTAQMTSPPPGKNSEPMFREEYNIERVAVGKIVTDTPVQRQEGDTLILPVTEEVLVTEKRLLLREEIRITRRREPVDGVRTLETSR